MRKTRNVLVLVCLALAATAALPAAGPASAGTAVDEETHIKLFSFRPNDLTVTAGDEILVINRDGQRFGVPHSATSVDGAFDSGVITTETATITAPSEPGRYKYICVIHPFMRGVLRVRPAEPL